MELVIHGTSPSMTTPVANIVDIAGWPPICQNEIPGDFQEVYIFFQETQKVENIPETMHIEENIKE